MDFICKRVHIEDQRLSIRDRICEGCDIDPENCAIYEMLQGQKVLEKWAKKYYTPNYPDRQEDIEVRIKDALNLSGSACNILARGGIKTMTDLENVTENTLIQIRGLGPKYRAEVKQAVKEYINNGQKVKGESILLSAAEIAAYKHIIYVFDY